MRSIESFENAIIERFEIEGINACKEVFGVCVKCEIDSWYIDVREVHSDGAMVKVYHKNVINKKESRKSKGGFPDAHLQMTRKMRVGEIVAYIKQHEKKYNKKQFYVQMPSIKTQRIHMA